MICKRPDRDHAGVICGHPIPCPYHTVLIDLTTYPPNLIVPITAEPATNPLLLERLKEISRILEEGGS